MFKKIFSIFMATTLIFSAETPIFAGSDDYKPIKNNISPRQSSNTAILSIERKIIQKAFLIGLLCSTGTNVEISSNNHLLSHLRLSVKKIGNGRKKPRRYSDEMTLLFNALRNKNFEFEFSNAGKFDKKFILIGAKVNDYFLRQSTIYKIGKKILKIIEEKRPAISGLSYNIINLNDDAELKTEILNVLDDLLKCNPDKNENTINFFEVPSCFKKKLDSITNPVHVDYLKQHPDSASHLVVCYQKMLFVGLLSAFGIETRIKLNETIDSSFPECIKVHNIDQHKSNMSVGYYHFLGELIEYINSVFPLRKLGVVTMPLAYSSPVKTVIINNNIFLNENDVFNLGQKFYNLMQKIISEYPIEKEKLGRYGLIDLSKVTIFTQNVKKIFKEYTGKDLPNLK